MIGATARRSSAGLFRSPVLVACGRFHAAFPITRHKRSQAARIILQAHIAKMQTLLFLLSPMLATSFFESSLFYPRTTDLFYAETPNYYNLRTYSSCANSEPTRSPTWSARNDAYTLKMVVPDLEPDSVTAKLGSDERGTSTVKIEGKRKIEACQCQPTQIREVPLPYRPRIEDVSIALDAETSTVTIELARGNTKSHDEQPLPLTLTKKTARNTEVAKVTEDELRSQEKSLTEKFRAAAQASLAVTSSKSHDELAEVDKA